MPEEKPEEEQDNKPRTKQVVTFSFPSAPQAFASEEEVDDPFKDKPATDTSEQNKEPEKEEESSDEDTSSSEEEGEKKENDRVSWRPPVPSITVTPGMFVVVCMMSVVVVSVENAHMESHFSLLLRYGRPAAHQDTGWTERSTYKLIPKLCKRRR